MDILKKLAELATTLDEKGLYEEANIVDTLIQSVQSQEESVGEVEPIV